MHYNRKIRKKSSKKVLRILVNNVLFELAKALKKNLSISRYWLSRLFTQKPNRKKFRSVKFGNNVLIGKNVKIGKNSLIGSNVIIEKNVKVGKNCIIGSGVIIKNCMIGNNVVLQDNSKIGQKGFGFIPIENKNFKFLILEE